MAKKLPEDVKQVCLWLARGYERRLTKEQVHQRNSNRRAGSGRRREVERLEAVEQALAAVGTDISAHEVRNQLQVAIMLNVKSGRKYPYEMMHLEGVSRSDFYRRKDKFLEDIACRMGLL